MTFFGIARINSPVDTAINSTVFAKVDDTIAIVELQ